MLMLLRYLSKTIVCSVPRPCFNCVRAVRSVLIMYNALLPNEALLRFMFVFYFCVILCCTVLHVGNAGQCCGCCVGLVRGL